MFGLHRWIVLLVPTGFGGRGSMGRNVTDDLQERLPRHRSRRQPKWPEERVFAAHAIPTLRVAVAVGLVGALASCGSESSPPTVSGPTVTVSSVSVGGSASVVGASAQFSATATSSNGTTSTVTAQATWSSSNTAVATVSSSAIVTGVGAGEADITATYQGVVGRSHLTIAQPEASTYTITGTVTDETSGGVLPNINVQAADSRQTSTSTVTDSSGSYSISGLAAGPVTIVASALSYQTTQLTASISSNTRLDIVSRSTVSAFTLSQTSFS